MGTSGDVEVASALVVSEVEAVVGGASLEELVAVSFGGLRLVVSDGPNVGFALVVVAVEELALVAPLVLLVELELLVGLEPSEAVEQCIVLVENSSLERKQKRPLLVSLKAAKAAFDREGWRVGKLMLRVFELKVYAQIGRSQPAEAASFVECAENIIKAIECVVKHTPRKGDDDGDDDDDRDRDDDD